jgi:hypothetical protein
VESSLPVIEYYNSKDKVKKIDAAKPIPEVFEDVKTIFAPYAPKVNYWSHLFFVCSFAQAFSDESCGLVFALTLYLHCAQ